MKIILFFKIPKIQTKVIQRILYESIKKICANKTPQVNVRDIFMFDAKVCAANSKSQSISVKTNGLANNSVIGFQDIIFADGAKIFTNSFNLENIGEMDLPARLYLTASMKQSDQVSDLGKYKKLNHEGNFFQTAQWFEIESDE